MPVLQLHDYVRFLDNLAADGGILTGLHKSGLQYYGFKFDPYSPLLNELHFVKRYENIEGYIYVFINLRDENFYITASPRSLPAMRDKKEL